MHDSLAMAVANALLSEPEGSVLTRVYCRSLTRMTLTPSNHVSVRVLSVPFYLMLSSLHLTEQCS